MIDLLIDLVKGIFGIEDDKNKKWNSFNSDDKNKDVHGNSTKTDVHGNRTDRNIHGNTTNRDIHGNPM